MSHNPMHIEEAPTRKEYERVFGHPEPVTDDHKTVHVESFDADIDEQVVDLVLQFNGDGAKTVSSCQGDPGVIGDEEGGRYGHVCFVMPNPRDYQLLAQVLFGFLYNLTKDMWDNVRVEMTTSDEGFLGWVYFRNECIQELLERLRGV